LAFVIFAVASLLVGKTPAADRMRRNVRLWLNLNIVLAVLVVCLSGVLRTAEKTPKKTPATQAVSRPEDDRHERPFARVILSINLESGRVPTGCESGQQRFWSHRASARVS
jgi:hypothetical protein